MAAQRIRIRLKAYDFRVIDQSAREIAAIWLLAGEPRTNFPILGAPWPKCVELCGMGENWSLMIGAYPTMILWTDV